jgi:hypothetical protein
MLIVVMYSVIILNVDAECRYAFCICAECLQAECRGADAAVAVAAAKAFSGSY